MAAYSWVCIGEDQTVPVSGFVREGYSLQHAALFLDNERVSEGLYLSSAKTIRDRLQLLGFGRARADAVVLQGWATRHHVENKNLADDPEKLIADFVIDLESEGGAPSVYENPSKQRLRSSWGYIWGEERSQLRYLVDRLPDEHPVAFDLREVIGRGHAAASETLCADARAEEITEASGTMPTITLTEGSSDASILEKALEILRPDLVGFLTFMDYSHKPDGGVGAVTNGLKAFSAAGVGNRIIGLYDNDTAGRQGLLSLRKSPLRPHMRGTVLPELELARSYPTYGPDGLSCTDINGRAVSVELFLGRDVLTIDGELSPVQWTQYVKPMNSYQGEISQKGLIQERFYEKVKTFSAASRHEKSDDWQDLEHLIDYIVQLMSTEDNSQKEPQN
ncbi:hypothetical protein E2F48_16065 [Arthrobacter crusticola]|uniref:HEPN/Toprim N-terminal domain-containing protein n=1 Tax=Arthrobacter crusticola TaxID=2547960 RepID=A0A4R5TQ91_9MICC|nr:hypothetical protein [Arthrobacter crusticola]TDK23505.1 hypothetical protein E2F48_16065 [Arthrobacter crusticola]